MKTPKVSIVVPCYNVERFLPECLESVVKQSLRDIEIICINDGSTDGTLAILKEYARQDDRIRILDKNNTGYGNSMNLAFDMARGKYLGIVESDDFAEPDMFETLYHAAEQTEADVAKSGFYFYSTKPEIRNVPENTLFRLGGEKVFCPMSDIVGSEKTAEFFRTLPAIWSAIYRREFIQDNGIRFAETPGASYQDVGFCFKVWSRAKRVKLVDRCLLHYRVDNAQSSVHNPQKVYCICDEYAEIERFLRSGTVDWERPLAVMLLPKYEHYLWNYERLAEPLQEQFLGRFYSEFKQHQAEGLLCREYFSWYDWNNLRKILLDPKLYHELQVQKDTGGVEGDFYDAYPDQRPIKAKIVYYLAENLAGAITYIRGQGVRNTMHLFLHKIRIRLRKIGDKAYSRKN